MQKYKRVGRDEVVVEAVQLTEDNVDAVANWTQAQIVEEKDALTHEASEGLNVRTPTGRRRASRGQFVVKHGDSFYVFGPIQFLSIYHKVDE